MKLATATTNLGTVPTNGAQIIVNNNKLQLLSNYRTVSRHTIQTIQINIIAFYSTSLIRFAQISQALLSPLLRFVRSIGKFSLSIAYFP